MIQVIFFALLIVTLLGGLFVYYAPSQKDPVKFMMDNTGYNTTETLNRKKSEQINMSTSKGIMQVRKQMADLAVEQNKFFDTIQDQQQILKNANKDASSILLEAKKAGQKGKDILQLQALTSEMQNQRLLLVQRGQDLISLNDQLTKNRQTIAEQVDLANINTESSLHELQQNSLALNNQASMFFDQVNQHNQEVHDQMDETQSKLQDMAKNIAYDDTVQQQNIKARIQHMMDREHEDMIKLADNEERCKSLAADARQNLEDSKERLDDLQQKNKDLIQEERQKEEDQQSMIQQRIADQEQRMQDQQNR